MSLLLWTWSHVNVYVSFRFLVFVRQQLQQHRSPPPPASVDTKAAGVGSDKVEEVKPAGQGCALQWNSASYHGNKTMKSNLSAEGGGEIRTVPQVWCIITHVCSRDISTSDQRWITLRLKIKQFDILWNVVIDLLITLVLWLYSKSL